MTMSTKAAAEKQSRLQSGTLGNYDSEHNPILTLQKARINSEIIITKDGQTQGRAEAERRIDARAGRWTILSFIQHAENIPLA